MRSPLGDVTSYVYDGNGRLGSIGSAAGAFTFTYDTLGRRSGLSYPNGVKAMYTYDNVGRLTGLYNTTSTGITFAKNEYTFDNVGNRVTNTNEARTAAYTYDDNYRLTSANYSTTGWSGVESAIKGKTGNLAKKNVSGSSYSGAGVTPAATAISNQTEHYTYDPLGNRLTAEKNRTYEYNAANQLVRDKDATYAYDRNGNLISTTSATGTTRYGYDFENRLTSVTNPDGTRVEFKYDVFGRRIEKKTVIASGSEAISSGSAEVTRYFYDGEDILIEYDGSGNVGNRYTHGPGIDEPLALTTDKGVYFYHADGLGSIVALTDKNQTVVQDYQYGFFGDLKDLKNRIKQPYTYTAREYDRETGLYFYRARYYDANDGRFLSKDPIGFAGGMNMYAYVAGNPVNYTDPWGEAEGHHFIPKSLYKNAGLPDEVVKFFDKAITGPLQDGHGWSKAHSFYNDAVRKLWDEFLEKNKLSCPKMTVKDAEKFLEIVKKSEVKEIKLFLWAMKNKKVLAKLAEAGMKGTTIIPVYDSLTRAFIDDPIGTLQMLSNNPEELDFL